MAAFEIASRFGSEVHAAAMAGPERACRMRIGLHTGAVVVGDLGYADRFDYTVVGDVVNRTKRIEGSLRGIAMHEAVVIGASRATIDACAARLPIITVEALSVGDAWRIVESE